MKESSGLRRLSKLALERRRKGLVELLPPAAETLRGTLRERYVTCGKPGCKCARGERHGPLWYLSVTLGSGRTAGGVIAAEQVERVRRWIENYHQIKEQGTSGKDFRDQSRTAAAGAPAKEKIAGRRRTTWSTIIPNFGLDFSILLR